MLRTLQKKHDTLATLLHRTLMKAMDADDYETFSTMLSSNADLFFEKKKLKEKIYTYYQKHHQRGNIPPLQARIKKDKKIVEVYSPRAEAHTNYTQNSKKSSYTTTQNSVTVLSTPTCPYCIKAKRYLHSKGIAFKDYNINNSAEGKRLYRQYNGSGVPLVIINGTVIHGYSEAQMRAALR